jgi:hypothetical protein
MAGRIKHPGDFMMLIPRQLDPVEAGYDTPLPPERPSSFSLSVSTMEDPTDVPGPETAPAAQPVAKPAAPAPKRSARQKQ